MRPIKFRAWSKNGGYFVQPDSWVDDFPNGLRFDDINNLLNQEGYVFQQFTGLLDKNGKEIYEGDILWTRMGKTQIQFVIQWDNERAEFTKFEPKRDYEVIGNIYENPELIETAGK